MPSGKSLKTLAVAGAWFFIVVSLGHLVWAVGHKWSDPAGTFKLYHTIVDGHSHDAWGLTYSGTLGLLTVMGQALVVAAAAAASVLPWQRSLKFRRIGHGVLCGWAALWALNFIWLASVDHQLVSTAQATLLCLLLGCTGYRATMGWSPGRSTAPPGGTHSEDAGGTHREAGEAGRFVRGIVAVPTHDSDASGILAVRATRAGSGPSVTTQTAAGPRPS